MPLDFVCPHCQASTLVDDEFCGRQGPCFSCGKEIFVPPPTEVGARRAGGTGTATATRPATGPQRSVLPVLVVILAGILAAGVSLVLIIAVAIPGYRGVRFAQQKATCRANLTRIGQALQRYHDLYGAYPPAYIADASGKKMHSWRVLILPQLNELSIYRQYRFDLPWNDPINVAATRRMPEVFGCPSDDLNAAAGNTNYFVVMGPRTAFPTDGSSTRLDQWIDPIAETLLVVEVANSGVGWAEPKDLDVIQVRMAINPGGSSSLSMSSEHPGGVHALFADGRVHWLSNAVPFDVLSAALTRDGQDQLDWIQLESD